MWLDGRLRLPCPPPPPLHSTHSPTLLNHHQPPPDPPPDPPPVACCCHRGFEYRVLPNLFLAWPASRIPCLAWPQLQGSPFVEDMNHRFTATMTNVVRRRTAASARAGPCACCEHRLPCGAAERLHGMAAVQYSVQCTVQCSRTGCIPACAARPGHPRHRIRVPLVSPAEAGGTGCRAGRPGTCGVGVRAWGQGQELPREDAHMPHSHQQDAYRLRPLQWKDPLPGRSASPFYSPSAPLCPDCPCPAHGAAVPPSLHAGRCGTATCMRWILSPTMMRTCPLRRRRRSSATPRSRQVVVGR